MEREDIQPWYRQFWPWFIIALLASSVIGGLTTVWISLQTTDSLVVRHDDGVQTEAEERVVAEQRAALLGLAFRLDVDLSSGAASVTLVDGDDDAVPATLQLDFEHPAFADRDQQLVLHRALSDADGNPVWAGHFVIAPQGRWYAILRAGTDWRIASEWQGQAQLILRAGDDEGR